MIIKDDIILTQHEKDLIKRLQGLPDFKYDDEEVELSKICKAKGYRWEWEQVFYNPQIIITKGVN